MNTLLKGYRLDDVSDVVWIQTSFIGDIVLTTAAFSALREISPHIGQHVITTKAGAEVLTNHPCIDSLHVFSKREGALAPALKVRRAIHSLKLNKPVTLQPHRSFRSSLLSKLIGYPTITYKETSGAYLASVNVPRVAVLHETDRISLLLEGLGIPREKFLGRRPLLPVRDLPHVASAMHRNLKWIGVAPGSVWATKRWPSAKFATLCQLILNDKTYGVVLLGSKDEQGTTQFIYEECAKARPDGIDRILNLAGQTNLQDLSGIYPRLTKLISNDSSPIHYASAFNTPTVAIFGATVPGMGFGPLADQSSIAEIQLNCRPCSDHGPKSCPLSHFRCMNDISVEQVIKMTFESNR